MKAVARVPEAIKKLNDDLSWTMELGEAFLAQDKDVMDAIQSMRGKAQEAGTLQTSPQQVVTVTNMVVEKTEPLAAGQTPYFDAVNDPIEGFNRCSWAVNDWFFRGILYPLSVGYNTVAPKPVRSKNSNLEKQTGLFLNVSAAIIELNTINQTPEL